MPISVNSQRLTAFNTYGTYTFLRLPMGLRTAPNSFQLLMDKILKGLTFSSVLCYLDDICIISEIFTQQLEDVTDVLGRLKNAGLRLGPKSVNLPNSHAFSLVMKYQKNGIKPPSAKVDVIKNFPTPTTAKQLQQLSQVMNSLTGDQVPP